MALPYRLAADAVALLHPVFVRSCRLIVAFSRNGIGASMWKGGQSMNPKRRPR